MLSCACRPSSMNQEGNDDVCWVCKEEIQLNYTRLNVFLIMQLHFLM